MTHIVIVGAGQAATSLAAKLRMLGYDGRLTMIGNEDVAPYQRPALSKKYLLGDITLDRLSLRPASFYLQNEISLRLGERVTGLDTEAGLLSFGSGTLVYTKLALTTGAVARTLPQSVGGLLKGVYSIRNVGDISQLRPEFYDGQRVLIVGGGYIGLEAAAVAATKGLAVTLVEANERILARVTAPETSDYFRTLHISHGVKILEGVGVTMLIGDERVSHAKLANGEVIPVDFVIVGIGVLPATSLAESAGIACDNGIMVDTQGRTSAPSVWAAGDCASFPWRGSRARLECVQNAVDQAEIVAADMMGHSVKYDPTPWFWSDQFSTKLQIAGWNAGYDTIVTRRTSDCALSVWYYRDRQFCAVDAVNDPRSYMVGKQLLLSGRTPAANSVSDLAVDLKSFLG